MTLKPSVRVRPLVGMLALLAALLVLPLALAPRAEAFIYWTDGSRIGRANLDGTGADPTFLTTGVSVEELALDAAHIYWSKTGTRNQEPYNGTIGRANLNGSGVDQRFIPNAGRPVGVVVDSAHVYWANWTRTNQGPYDDTIWRANVDGSGVDQSFITGPSYLTGGVAVDAAHIYWLDSYFGCAIDRANLDGTGVEQRFISAPDWSYCSGLAVDAEHIYWASGPGTIGRANLDGSGVEPSFITGASFPDGVAVDAAHIYWTNPITGTIGRANLDGTGVDQSFIGPVSAEVPVIPRGIAVNFSLGDLRRDKKRGTARLTVEVPAPGGIALAQTTKVKGAEVRAEAAGVVQLPIEPQGKAKKKLAEKGKVRVGVEITYTPDGGEPDTQTTALKLKRG